MKKIIAYLSKIFKSPAPAVPVAVEPVEEFIAPEASAPPAFEDEKPKKKKIVRKKVDK